MPQPALKDGLLRLQKPGLRLDPSPHALVAFFLQDKIAYWPRDALLCKMGTLDSPIKSLAFET